jgi:hypothetical protein
MNTPDQYKDEALRFLDMYPLEACKRVSERLNGRGWKLKTFDCKVEIFDTIRWYVKVHIKTDVTKQTLEQKWAELQAIFMELDLAADLVMSGLDNEYETVAHRKYDRSDVVGHRILRGQWYDFHVQFKPAKSLELSVLTEEEA